MGKRENADYKHFLLLPQCFQKLSSSRVIKTRNSVIKQDTHSPTWYRPNQTPTSNPCTDQSQTPIAQPGTDLSQTPTAQPGTDQIRHSQPNLVQTKSDTHSPT